MQSLARLLTHRNPLLHSTRTLPLRPLSNMTPPSTSYSTSQPATTTSSPPTSQTKAPLALPEIAQDQSTQLDMSSGSTTVKLDHLGPMVVGVDGTLSRISNWEGMTEGEKEATLRVIGRRNQQRLKALREKEGGD